jgi:hypothetical protein
MQNQIPLSKPADAEQESGKGLDETTCSALQLCSQRVAGHIQKPMDIHAIVSEIDSDEYNAELMLQHLLLWAAKTECHLKNPHCVRAMALLGEINLPNAAVLAPAGEKTPTTKTNE